MGQPLRLGNGGPLFPDVAEPGHGEQFLPAAELGRQALEQPRGALGLRAADDRAAVREVGQRQQGAVAAVDPVQVDVRGAVRQREGAGDRAQQLRPPGPRRARRHQVGEGVQGEDRRLLLLDGRQVDEPEHARKRAVSRPVTVRRRWA